MGQLLAFVAEGPGAQLFMLLMGIYFSFQQHARFLKVAGRSVVLLTAGYLLNILKFIIPLYLGVLPAALQSDLQVGANRQRIIHLLLLGDILHFASLALLILYLIRKAPHYHYWALCFSVMIVFLSPFVWDMAITGAIGNHVLQLFTGGPPRIFFPVFPWLVYPLLGLAIGYFLQQNRNSLFSKLRDIGVALIITAFLLKSFVIQQESISFYRTLPLDTLQHIAVVLLVLYAWEWLYNHVMQNHFFRLLSYMSRHITQVYILQWIIIAWMLPFYGYHELDFTATLMAITFTTGLTFFISVLLNLKRYATKKDL